MELELFSEKPQNYKLSQPALYTVESEKMQKMLHENRKEIAACKPDYFDKYLALNLPHTDQICKNIFYQLKESRGDLPSDEKDLLQKETEWTKHLFPSGKPDGYATFKKSKKLVPFKFQYKLYEAGDKEIVGNGENGDLDEEEKAKKRDDIVWEKKLMKKEFFQDNPHLIEFANRNMKEGETPNSEELKKKAAKLAKQRKKKRKDESKLVWGRPNFGIYDRYGAGKSNLD